ncbi:MAG: tetratricopeptide repeat protein [Elusimicrobiota bacterium]
MRTRKLGSAVLLAGALLAALPGRARASFEDTEFGPRGTAMAGAVASNMPHATAMFYNPALMTGVQTPEFFTSYENMYMGLTDGSKLTRQLLALAYPLNRGRRGYLGLGVNMFALDALYKEQAIMLNYGRAVGKKLSWGLGIRQLSVTYGSDEYTTGKAESAAGGSASAMGLDLGIQYRSKGRRIGFAILNANEPDLGIVSANKVDRTINIGIAKMQPTWEWQNQLTRTGADIRLKSGLEHRGAFKSVALRVGFSIGSRQYRNIAMGFGYIREKFQIDYAMLMPVSGVSSGMGNHQVGLTWRFGRGKRRKEKEPKRDDDDEERIIVAPATTTVQISRPAIVMEMARKQADSLVSDAMGMLDVADYDGALKKLRKANDLPVEDPQYKMLEVRVAAVARLDPSIKGGYTKNRLVRRGLSAFALGDGKTTLESLLYAKQKWPSDKEIERLYELAARQYPDIGARMKPIQGLNVADQKLEEALSLIYDGQYTAAVTLCQEVLELEPNSVLALVRQGSAYWALGRRQTARAVWKRALELDPGNKDVLEFLNRKEPAPATPSPGAQPSVKPVAEPAAQPAVQPAGKPSAEIEKQYKEQVEYYKRMQRMGVNKHMLELILKQMVRRFEGTGIDMKYLKEEAKKY